MTDIHGLKPNVRPNTPYNVTAQIRGDIREIVQHEIEQIAIGTIGAETPAGAQAKVDTSAASLTAAIAAAKAELQAADALLAPLVHTHDDRYYLKSQVEAALSGKAALVHTHHDLYYVKSEIDALLVGTGAVHNHNDLYYLKSEISAFLSGKAAAVHSHDDRYFTESEVNSLLAGKAAAVHSHNDLYYTEAEVDALIAGVSGGAGWTPVAASTSVQGIVELATVAETTTGTDGSLAVTPPGLRAVLDARGLLYAPALGADDNYVTDAEKAALHTHPAVIAQGATAADARTAIGAGTSSFTGDYDDLTSKPTLGTAAATAATDYATAAQGAKADTALQPATPQTINAQTAAYTLVAADAGKLVQMTLSAAGDLTVPADVFTAGQRVDLSDRGTARVTVVADSGMTVNPPPGGTLVMEGRYAYASLVFVSATEADLVGLVAGA